jgi:transcriptional regulator with XRE-family HTH domain
MCKKGELNAQTLLALLRAARREAGMRQVDLANRLRRPQSYVSKYESGERRLDLLELRQICNALGISLEAFVRKLESAIDEG